MGCCYSSDNEPAEQDSDERKPLIPHPNPDKPANGTERSPAAPPSTRPDEQALLNTILHRTAQSIIDVSAADSQGMEQHEYMDKARQYSTKLAVLSSTLSQKKPTPLPSLTSQPHQVLASDLIPTADLHQTRLLPFAKPDARKTSTVGGFGTRQVSKIAAYAYSAISQIKVDAKEELVVQFAVP